MIRLGYIILVSLLVAGCNGRHPFEDSIVTDEAIDRLVDDLSESRGLWVNGIFPRVELPESADAEAIVKAVFEGRGLGNVTIVGHRQVYIDPLPYLYTAALVDTESGKKIVLARHLHQDMGWWTQVRDLPL